MSVLPPVEILKNIAPDVNGPVSSNPDNFVSVGAKLFFTADDQVHGRELWVSNGYEGGTHMVRDINPGSGSSYPRLLAQAPTALQPPVQPPYPGKTGIVFAANDGSGDAVWFSDGLLNKENTFEVAQAGSISDLKSTADELVFSQTNGDVYGLNSSLSDGLLHKAQPSLAISGITDLAIVPPNSLAGGQELLFAATLASQNSSAIGFDLWGASFSQTGFTAKPVFSMSANSNCAHCPGFPRDLTQVGSEYFFSAARTGFGRELWKTDGTEDGTVMIKDINHGQASSDPANLINFNGTLYFTATDHTHGRQLWKSDGTSAGTVSVSDIITDGDSAIGNLTISGGSLYFTANNGHDGSQLWKTDGTTAGTVEVTKINPSGFNPSNLVDVGGTLYLAADDGIHGREVWTSDGTPAGTALFTDINPSGSSNPHDLTNVNGQLFLAADDGVHGVELCRTGDFTFPSIQYPADQTNNELDSVTLPLIFSDSDGDPLTFFYPVPDSLYQLPPGLTINTAGVISGTISGQAFLPIPYQVIIGAKDEVNTSNFITFNWTIIDNTVPMLTNPGDQTNNEGDPVSLSIHVTDADGDIPGTFNATGLPPGLTINPHTGIISGTLSSTSADGIPPPSPYMVTVSASDGVNTGQTVFAWTVKDTTPPVIVNPGDQGNNEGDIISLPINATDADNDPLTYSAQSLPAGLSINSSTGVISGTLGGQSAGSYPVEVFASDGHYVTQVTFTWTVSDITTPVVTTPGNLQNNEGDTVSQYINAGDADGDPLTYSATNLPPGLSINPIYGVISGTVGNQAAGTYQVTVFASDGFNTGKTIFTWTIGDPTLPMITNPGDQRNLVGDTVNLQIQASDADNDPLTYSAGGTLPSGLTIDPNTGLISGTVTGSSTTAVIYSVHIVVSDGTNMEGIDFLWTISGPTTVT